MSKLSNFIGITLAFIFIVIVRGVFMGIFCYLAWNYAICNIFEIRGCIFSEAFIVGCLLGIIGK